MNRFQIIGNILLGIAITIFVAAVWGEFSYLYKKVQVTEDKLQTVVDGSMAWAAIREYHAVWNAGRRVVHQSVVFERYQDCTSIPIVSKKMYLVGPKGDVLGDPVTLVGELGPQMQNVAPEHTATLFDEARLEHPEALAPGKYIITLEASCEQDTGVPSGPEVVRTAPISATIEISPPARSGPRH